MKLNQTADGGGWLFADAGAWTEEVGFCGFSLMRKPPFAITNGLTRLPIQSGGAAKFSEGTPL